MILFSIRLSFVIRDLFKLSANDKIISIIFRRFEQYRSFKNGNGIRAYATYTIKMPERKWPVVECVPCIQQPMREQNCIVWRSIDNWSRVRFHSFLSRTIMFTICTVCETHANTSHWLSVFLFSAHTHWTHIVCNRVETEKSTKWRLEERNTRHTLWLIK